MADQNIVNLVYATAKKAGASDTVMLALFEACIVESGFTNPQSATDHDSIGVLQQRPSAGWPNPGDVPTAVNSFVSRAKAKEGSTSSAGMLAQSVQVSAFPLKYDAVKVQAAELIGSAAKAVGGVTGSALDDLINKFKSLVGGGIAGAGGALGAATGWIKSVGDFFDALTDPATWIRVALFVVGGGLIFFGIMKMTGDNKLSDGSKTILKTGAKLAATAAIA